MPELEFRFKGVVVVDIPEFLELQDEPWILMLLFVFPGVENPGLEFPESVILSPEFKELGVMFSGISELIVTMEFPFFEV